MNAPPPPLPYGPTRVRTRLAFDMPTSSSSSSSPTSLASKQTLYPSIQPPPVCFTRQALVILRHGIRPGCQNPSHPTHTRATSLSAANSPPASDRTGSHTPQPAEQASKQANKQTTNQPSKSKVRRAPAAARDIVASVEYTLRCSAQPRR